MPDLPSLMLKKVTAPLTCKKNKKVLIEYAHVSEIDSSECAKVERKMHASGTFIKERQFTQVTPLSPKRRGCLAKMCSFLRGLLSLEGVSDLFFEYEF
jgi:hypothetical protein